MNCIQNTTELGKSWCGNGLDAAFYFKDTEAAVINGIHGSLHPCPECVNLVIKYLESKVNYGL